MLIAFLNVTGERLPSFIRLQNQEAEKASKAGAAEHRCRASAEANFPQHDRHSCLRDVQRPAASTNTANDQVLILTALLF